MSNFAFLSQKPAYVAFSAACIEAEKVCASSPAMCALGCRKALELAIKWVYAADCTISAPYRDNLQSLLHEYTFRSVVEPLTWSKLPYIVRLGNLAAHTAKSISRGDAERERGKRIKSMSHAKTRRNDEKKINSFCAFA